MNLAAPAESASPLLAAALDYAARGWPVLPLHSPRPDGSCDCGRTPGENCKPAKHPRTRNGLTDATTDPETIRGWWCKWPKANIGIRTGACSGLVVLDLDGAEGRDALFALEAQNGDADATVTANSARGYHLYFAHTGPPIKSRAAVGGHVGLDVRGENGYIVTPPSIHATGKPYTWGVPPGDVRVSMAPLPLWMFALLNAAPNGNGTGNGTAPRIETAAVLAGLPEGRRDDQLFRFVCKLRRADVPQATALRLALESAANCQPPYPPESVREKVTRAYSIYKAEPVNDAPPLAELDVLALIKSGVPTVIMDVEDFLPRRTVCYMTGAPKGHKTWTSLDVAVCLCTGKDFAGLRVPEPRRVLFLEAESWLQIPERFERLCRGHGVSPADVLERLRFIIPKVPLRLDRPDHAAALLDAVKEWRADWLFLDSFVRLHGLDENSSHDMALLANGALLPVRDEGGAGVLVLDHPPKPWQGVARDRKQQIRGSWEKLAAADVQLHVDTIDTPEGKAAALSVAASRVAQERESPVYLRLRDTPNGGIRFEQTDAPDAPAPAGRKPTVFERAVNIIKAEKGRDPNLAHAGAIARCMAEGVGERTAGTAWAYCKVQEVQK